MANERSLTVLMGGRPVGTLSAGKSGHPTLTYDDWVVEDEDAIGLSLAFPPVGRRYTGARVGTWIQGLLPDRGEVLDRWRRDFGIRATDAFSLLWHVGEDVAGAAQFVRPERLDAVDSESTTTLLRDAEIATRLRALVADRAAWAPASSLGQFSLAGAQAKFALAWTVDGWAQPTGQHPTTHIFKPAMANLADQDLNEHLTMQTASLLGLAVPQTHVVKFEDERALVVERFDRLKTSRGWVRVHQEDMCQAAGVEPSRKYESQGGPGVDKVAGLIREAVRAPYADQDVLNFVLAVAFSWLVVGTDAHAKNYALLHVPGQSRLAPLFDLNSYLPYGDPRNVTLSMTVGAYHREPTRITAADWVAVAKTCGLAPLELLDQIQDMAHRLPDAAAQAASQPTVAALGSDLPAKFVDLVSDYATSSLDRLTAGRARV